MVCLCAGVWSTGVVSGLGWSQCVCCWLPWFDSLVVGGFGCLVDCVVLRILGRFWFVLKVTCDHGVLFLVLW